MSDPANVATMGNAPRHIRACCRALLGMACPRLRVLARNKTGSKRCRRCACRDAGSSKAQQSTQRRWGAGITYPAEGCGRLAASVLVKMRSNPMLTRFAVATAAVLLGCGSAYAQAPLNVSPLPPLGLTSPLGIPNAPVGHTGIPMGATELASPGVSPTTFGASPLIGAACAGASPAPASATTSSPMTGASAGMGSSSTSATSTTGADTATASAMTGSSGTAPFDGGGTAATVAGTCAAAATASAPLASSMGPGSSVGPVGIPLGSTEIGGGGLSPPSVVLNPNPSAPAVGL